MTSKINSSSKDAANLDTSAGRKTRKSLIPTLLIATLFGAVGCTMSKRSWNLPVLDAAES